MKVEPVRKQDTGTSRMGEGLGAVFLLKYHQKEGLRVRMMFSWTMPDRDRKMRADSCVPRERRSWVSSVHVCALRDKCLQEQGQGLSGAILLYSRAQFIGTHAGRLVILRTRAGTAHGPHEAQEVQRRAYACVRAQGGQAHLARGGHAIVVDLELGLGAQLRPLKPQVRADEGHQQDIANDANSGNGKRNGQVLGHVPVQGEVSAVHLQVCTHDF